MIVFYISQRVTERQLDHSVMGHDFFSRRLGYGLVVRIVSSENLRSVQVGQTMVISDWSLGTLRIRDCSLESISISDWLLEKMLNGDKPFEWPSANGD